MENLKPFYFEPSRKEVALYLEKLIESKAGKENALAWEEIYTHITEPPQREMGDLAFPCFPLAKLLRGNPAKIAAELLQLSTESFTEESSQFTKVSTQGPYLNFHLDYSRLAQELIPQILSEKFFEQTLTQNTPRTMIEYCQPNTHKELHVGHMRNLCLGNALIRLLRYCNFDIVSATFPGDVGTHVAKCLWYLKKYNKEKVPESNKGAWLGKIYTKATLLLEDELGSEKEEQNRSELTAILAELESGSGEYYDLWKETREWSIELMKKAYDWADVQFDQWYWESDVDSSSVAYAKKLYEQGLLVKDQGAIGMNLEEEKLGFCILIKSDGNGLYATKDLELARRKFEENKIEKSIYIVDKRQAFHFKQVFTVLEKIGFEQAKGCEHLAYDFVELPDGAMSSRKGNIVPLMDLINQMQETIKVQYLNKYTGVWEDSEIESTAKKIAEGAIKFGMLKYDTHKKIVFDMHEWLKLEGESGPYLQYVYARISSLCDKLGIKDSDKLEASKLNHQLEKNLLYKLSQFNQQILSSTHHHKTHLVCSYLFELCKAFNAFYAECQVGNAEDPELKAARGLLCLSVAQVLQKGLNLLGIPTVNRM